MKITRLGAFDPTVSGLLEHDKLGSLGADDHPQYLLADGSRDLSGDLTITGSLTVQGTTTTIDTVNMVIEDNKIELNKGEAGTGVTAGVAGIRIDRGLATDYHIIFDETDDKFKVGLVGSTTAVSLDGHNHDDRYYTESEVTTISGDLVSGYTAADTTLSGLVYTSATTDAYSYTDTVSGVLSAEISAGDAATLSSAYSYTDTASGSLNSAKSDVGHNHDSRYYTESEVTTISGNIVAQIPSDFYSQAQVTTISGDIVAQIPSDFYSQSTVDGLLTTTSGDIVAQIPSDFYSQSQVTTISGDIVAQIPSLSGYATEAYVTTVSGDIVAQFPTDFYSVAEITTISGDIVAQIPSVSDFVTDAEITTISGDIVAQIPSLSGYATESYVDTAVSGVNASGWSGSIPTVSGMITVVSGIITNYA